MITSLFGKRKFGTFKFGPVVLSSPRYGLQVDWDSAGLFDGSNEGSNLVDFSVERGRKYTIDVNGEGFEEEETGRFDATLVDDQQRYDPYNTNSPLFGKVTGGKIFKTSVRTPVGNIFPIMAGILDEPVSYDEHGRRMARLTGSDGWAFLRDQVNVVTIPLQESVYADDAMRMVLDEAGWPRLLGTNLDAGVDARPYFWVDARSPARVIHELAHSELGTVNMAANGNLRFRSRNYDDPLRMTVITSDDCMSGGIRRLTPAEAIRNLLQVKTWPRAEQTTQEVWALPGYLQIGAGETIDDIWAEFAYSSISVPVRSPIAPVATTDYQAGSAEGLSDLTASITVGMTSFATRAKLSVTNNAAVTAYVSIRVRGNPLIRTNSATFEYTDAASVEQFGPRPFLLEIENSVNVARAYRDLLGLFLSQARNYMVIDLLPDWDMQFGLDLGDRVRLELPGVNQRFKVIRIRHKWRDSAGIVVDTQVYLEPFVSMSSGVQIPIQIPFQLGSL